jgi:GTPase SAR1 family protein
MKDHSVVDALEPIAKEILASFTSIVEAAVAELRSMAGGGGDVFANTSNSSFTTLNPASINLERGSRAVRENCDTIRREPAIARVVSHDGSKDCISYICRASPPVFGSLDVVNQRAPKGRLAALPVGGSLTLPNGKVLTVLSRTELHPKETSDGWDSHNSVFTSDQSRPFTIESLLALLSSTATDSGLDLLSLLLADEAKKDLISEGSKRSVLTSMQLRDQAILDAHQDEIFRLPLNEQIFLAGPPGTGKTTTLIRRLGQKLDRDYLSDDEQSRVARAEATGSESHADSWLMFTPTELLRQYVKEAFSRERIPASDLRIRTWDEYRREIARNHFKILRSASSRSFVLRIEAQNTDAHADEDQKGFYDDFDVWQRQQLLEELSRAANALRDSDKPRANSVGALISKLVARTDIHSFADLFIAIARKEDELRLLIEELRTAVDGPLRGALNQRLNKDKSFILKLSEYLQKLALQDEADQDESAEDDEEDDDTPSGSGVTLAVNAYMAALRNLLKK